MTHGLRNFGKLDVVQGAQYSLVWLAERSPRRGDLEKVDVLLHWPVVASRSCGSRCSFHQPHPKRSKFHARLLHAWGYKYKCISRTVRVLRDWCRCCVKTREVAMLIIEGISCWGPAAAICCLCCWWLIDRGLFAKRQVIGVDCGDCWLIVGFDLLLGWLDCLYFSVC